MADPRPPLAPVTRMVDPEMFIDGTVPHRFRSCGMVSDGTAPRPHVGVR